MRELLNHVGYPGMKILSFAFNGDSGNLYLPERIEENFVCYTGTHDNDTLMGLIDGASEWDYNNLVRGVENSIKVLGLKLQITDKASLANAIIELGFASKADTFILPIADVLFYSTDYRINEPGTVKEQNWAIKFRSEDLKKSTANKLKKLCVKYLR